MTKPIVSYRRIDQLKAIAYDRGFTNEDAKQFGKLSKTATWEALLELYLVDGELLDTVNVDSVDALLDIPLDTVIGSVDAVSELLDTAIVDSVDTVLDTPLDTSETVASSRKQFDCLYTLTAPLDTVLESVDTLDWTNDGSFPVCGFTRQTSTSFLDWVDLGQLIALALASAGLLVLAMSMWRQINPLNLFPSPVRINIQIGTKL
ncbi:MULTISPECIES: hypothetical protein [unclassified Microcoleus]|uniref:hypothetical protein n=1 Tax=unclassified Microcoleus TaxID=2642155 RepID=UPI002FD48D2E